MITNVLSFNGRFYLDMGMKMCYTNILWHPAKLGLSLYKRNTVTNIWFIYERMDFLSEIRQASA